MTNLLHLPVPAGPRGGGLGNEVIPWAKAYLGAHVLGGRLIPPRWSLNTRGYRELFAATRLDLPVHALLPRLLPAVTVTADLYRSTGELDYASALSSLWETRGWNRRRGPLVVRHEGMSGGFGGVAPARDFLEARLLAAPGVVDDLVTLERAAPRDGRARVGVHLRLGDFARHAGAGPGPGVWNQSLPVSWYANVLDEVLRRVTPAPVVLLATDSPQSPQVRELAERVGAQLLASRRNPALSDVVALARCDLLLCSVSSYSMLAALLSRRPYVWFAPHLSVRDGRGWLWDEDVLPGGPDRAVQRGVTVGSDGQLPAWLPAYLREQGDLAHTSSDLVLSGSVPTSVAARDELRPRPG